MHLYLCALSSPAIQRATHGVCCWSARALAEAPRVVGRFQSDSRGIKRADHGALFWMRVCAIRGIHRLFPHHILGIASALVQPIVHRLACLLEPRAGAFFHKCWRFLSQVLASWHNMQHVSCDPTAPSIFVDAAKHCPLLICTPSRRRSSTLLGNPPPPLSKRLSFHHNRSTGEEPCTMANATVVAVSSSNAKRGNS